MKYLLLLLLPILVSTKVLLQGHYSKTKVRSLADIFYLMGLIFTAIAVITGIFFFRVIPSVGTVLFALVFGVANYVYQISYCSALRTGPVSLTSIICNFNRDIFTKFFSYVYIHIFNFFIKVFVTYF